MLQVNRQWVKRDEIDTGRRPGPTTDERRRIVELEKDGRGAVRFLTSPMFPPAQAGRHRRRARWSSSGCLAALGPPLEELDLLRRPGAVAGHRAVAQPVQ